MGREGFEPPKRFRNGFTARPIWPLWNLPAIRCIVIVLVAVSEPAKGFEPLTR